ncbi:MAG: UDP-N-acetylmuramate--L-alanine ligase [Bifidobacteriaceae bacterium]|jgi:UDP-N-acetylmuramate--alanine ligase|nr:UDP-N-acetylmuramate--L-alanine ligase [Bifidobacteriaceae bacterium]
MRYHLMGVGGVGMAAVAELLRAAGHDVSGCDGKDSPTLARLAGLGVATMVGHDPAHLDGIDRLVVSSAIKADNPELAAARAAGLEVWHRSQALAALGRDRRLVAVAGAHGKTSTSAMAAVALEAAGVDPGYAIGAEVLGKGTGAHLGTGPAMVIEADESDGSFLRYGPEIAVVTNVEPDHLDYYGTAEALYQAFRDFAGTVRPNGWLIACADDPGARELVAWAVGEPRPWHVLTYGFEAGTDVHLVELPGTAEFPVRFELVVRAGAGFDLPAGLVIELPVAGRHQALNAAAALLAAVAAGAEPGAAARGLATYQGTGRRFEARGTACGVRVFDDYAHHPTEIMATLAAARAAAGEGRVLVVFQPHLYSRTRDFADQFAAALSQADRAWVLDVYGAREEPLPGVTSALITDRMDPAKGVPAGDGSVVPDLVAALARPGDLVLTMGAGDVTELGRPIVAALARRDQAEQGVAP